LEELHGVFQVVMGWQSLHLYRFRIHAAHYGSWELETQSPERSLASFRFRRGDKFVYEYDMHDSWVHEIRIEDWLEQRSGKHYPICVGGKGTCPPEECGGPVGYDQGRAEAFGLDAYEDIDTMAKLLDRIVLRNQLHLLGDDDVRAQVEGTLERTEAREPFWRGHFSRRSANSRLRADEHHVLKHQRFC
jgi:hypothetical protein